MPSHAIIEGWHRLENDLAYLVAKQCTKCSTYYFPPRISYCRNPKCDSDSFKEALLSRTGTIWSYSKQYYQPPKPYVISEGEEFKPYIIAAVMLEKEKIIILGHMTQSTDVGDIAVGDSVELVVEALHQDDQGEHVLWKWQKC